MKENLKKDKCQMPKLDNFLSSLGKIITQDGNREVWLTSVELRYAFRQVLLNPELSKHCYFAIIAIIAGKASGLYCFITGFYGLTVMPTKFQRILEELYTKCFLFLDDILIVTKGTEEKHEEKVRKNISEIR